MKFSNRGFFVAPLCEIRKHSHCIKKALRLLLLPIALVVSLIPFKYSGLVRSKMGCNICGPADLQFKNVILLSLSFMMVFTAFQTVGNIEKTVLKSDPAFNADGFVSLGIIYLSFSLCNWIAPAVVAFVGPKYTLIGGSILYTAFIASFLVPNPYLLYSMSGILGFGAAALWTAQGSYLTLSSSPETLARNSGVFWAIFQCSMFFGNSFVFWQFDSDSQIAEKRILVFSVLSAVSFLGVVSMVFLRPLRPVHEIAAQHSSVDALKKSIALVKDPRMILLCVTFFYTGIELSFFSGVYASAVGFTAQMSKRLIGLIGILVGAGEIIGGAAFGILGSKTVKYGRDPVVLLGFLAHIVAFYLIFINLPNNSPQGPTSDVTYVTPSVGCLLLAATLLGFGDACFNTQIYSMIGSLFSDCSASAFAMFKFIQSAAAALSFMYSTWFTLLVQLSILVIFCFLGTLAFFIVEWGDTSDSQVSIPSVLQVEVSDAEPLIHTTDDDAIES